MNNAVIEKHEQIVREAKINKSVDVRNIDVNLMPIGKSIRQGDVYIKRVEKIDSKYSIPTMDLQLAKGNTQGSRHILEQNPSLRIFRNPNANALEGPAFESKTDVLLTHPEHGHFLFKGGGAFTCTYQRDFSQEILAAVKD